MRPISTIAEMRNFSREARARGKSVALVPTMGALHEGHLSLVRQAKRQCDVIVVSVFVNPKQFDSAEDLARYPRDLEKDLELLRPFKVDAAFAPDASELYPEGFSVWVEEGELAIPLEGASRPGHFRGVATVVVKLLNIVKPDVAYFGQKDFQQAQIIRRVVGDLDLDVRLMVCPTVRAPDGVAVSSRNAYLNEEQRRSACALYRSLRLAEDLAHSGETDARKVLDEMRKLFASEPGVELEYAAIVEPAHLQPVEHLAPGCVALVAARVGPARLIDNLILGPPGTNPEMLLQLALSSQPVVSAAALIPGFETEAVRLRVARCRNCAAISTIQLPPHEYLSAYVKLHYPDLAAPRVAVIGRDAPATSEMYLYQNPQGHNRFVARLYELVGVRSFAEFKARFVLVDAVRCHTSGPHVPENALAYCAEHLRAELKLFPNLDTLIVLGADTYNQVQRFLLERAPASIKPFDELLKMDGWAREEARVPSLSDRSMRIFYCYHPTLGYSRSSSIAPFLG